MRRRLLRCCVHESASNPLKSRDNKSLLHFTPDNTTASTALCAPVRYKREKNAPDPRVQIKVAFKFMSETLPSRFSPDEERLWQFRGGNRLLRKRGAAFPESTAEPLRHDLLISVPDSCPGAQEMPVSRARCIQGQGGGRNHISLIKHSHGYNYFMLSHTCAEVTDPLSQSH